MIREEAVDEAVRGGLDSNARERAIEEVWVIVDTLLEALCSEAGEKTNVKIGIRIRDTGLHGIQVVPL